MENKVLFDFNDEVDVERVMHNGPWAYDHSLVVCQRVVANVPIKEVSFTHSLFWVQLHDLPVLSMNQEVSETIGQRHGGTCAKID
jgi:hypothetical protein